MPLGREFSDIVIAGDPFDIQLSWYKDIAELSSLVLYDVPPQRSFFFFFFCLKQFTQSLSSIFQGRPSGMPVQAMSWP